MQVLNKYINKAVMAVKITGKPSFAVNGYLSILYVYKRAEDDRTVDLTWFYPGKSRDY